MSQLRNRAVWRVVSVWIVASCIAGPVYAKYSGGTGEPNNPYQIATAADLIALGNEPNDYSKHFLLTADIDLDPNLPGGKVFADAVVARIRPPGMGGRPTGTFFGGVFDGKGHTISHLTIRGSLYVGLFGWVLNGAEIRDLGVVDVNAVGSSDLVGALVVVNEGSIERCHSTGRVAGMRYVGGLVGWSSGTIRDCTSSGDVAGDTNVGGLLGGNDGEITGCFAAGNVSAKLTGAGGLVGDNTGRIVNCYARGSVAGNSAVGGLVGSNGYIQRRDIYYEAPGEIINSYSTGAVSGTADAGGLVGLHVIGPVVSSFWDIQTSGQAKSGAGVGQTTAQMQDRQTYLDAGWDWVGEIRNGTTEIWQMPPEGGYPILSSFAGHTPPQLKGSGTPDDPYLISSPVELGAVACYSPLAHYRLAASIDLSGIRWATAVIPQFGGTFDGNGCAISHLTIQGGSYLGLFGQVKSAAQIANLGVVDVNIVGAGSRVGGLAAMSGGAMTGCYSTGSVKSGGSGQHIGIGGLVGYNSGAVAQCHSTAMVDGTSSFAGGLVGENGGSLTRCYSTGAVSTTGRDVGGLAGDNGGTVTQCFSTGPVSATSGDAGGLIGGNYLGGVVTQCYSSGTVRGPSNLGGLIGWNVATVSQCYSAGAVNGKTNGNVAGLAWGTASLGLVTACFWDTQTSGQVTSVGGTGLTTAEMWTAQTFLDAGWDFVGETANGTEDVWWIEEGKDYPRLSWEERGKVDF